MGATLALQLLRSRPLTPTGRGLRCVPASIGKPGRARGSHVVSPLPASSLTDGQTPSKESLSHDLTLSLPEKDKDKDAPPDGSGEPP